MPLPPPVFLGPGADGAIESKVASGWVPFPNQVSLEREFTGFFPEGPHNFCELPAPEDGPTRSDQGGGEISVLLGE